jgi:phosphoribosylaminoimidazolecarboxamide formyltransferase/IMP cyclohydrolase
MRKQAGLPEKLFLEYDLKQSLRYGENPHQSANFYAASEPVPFSLAFGKQLQGKELSYNNIQDANAALNVVRDFDEPFCVALKHMNPCGAAVGKTIEEAWQAAYEADTVSIYGGIVAVNRPLTKEVALGMKPIFLEIVIAPSFTPEAMEILSTKKNLRVMEVDMHKVDKPVMQYVGVNGGLLAQHLDTQMETLTADMCVTKVKPTEAQMKDMAFGWRIVKHVKSNAIAVVRDNHTIGIGAGQTNRVGSAEIALNEAKAAGFTENIILASDGFLPFDDTVVLASKYGVTAIVQPGGSIRDEDAIKKADELGITMLFTGVRHFKH